MILSRLKSKFHFIFRSRPLVLPSVLHKVPPLPATSLPQQTRPRSVLCLQNQIFFFPISQISMVKTRSSQIKLSKGNRSVTSKTQGKAKKVAKPARSKKPGPSSGTKARNKKTAPSPNGNKKYRKQALASDVELEGPTKKPPKEKLARNV